MFERFTDRARRVVVLAQEEARLLHHNYIGTEHILLGLIHEGDGVAAKALDRLGISLDAVRDKVATIIGEGGSPVGSGHIPFTPRAKKVLELSLREALQLGHNYIGTEHILLGLIREGEGVAAQVLMNLGADLSQVRQEVVQLLSGYGPSGLGRPGTVGTVGMERPRQTPAAARAGVEARRLAGGGAVGSQHYLMGLLHDEDSLAAKALASLGITPQAIEEKLGELEPTGTSDETPEEAGARRIGLRVEGRLIMLEVDDPDLAKSLEQAMVGRKLRIIRGTDPEAASFPGLWSAFARTVDDLTRRLAKATVGRGQGTSAETEPWRPLELDISGHSAGYIVATRPDASVVCHLELAPGADSGYVRERLRAWIADNRVAFEPESQAGGGASHLWVVVDASRDADFAVCRFGFGPVGPPGAPTVPIGDLLDAALADLA